MSEKAVDLTEAARTSGLMVDPPQPHGSPVPEEAAEPLPGEQPLAVEEAPYEPVARIVPLDPKSKLYAQAAFIGAGQQVRVDLTRYPELPFGKDGEPIGGVVRITPLFTQSSCDHTQPPDVLDQDTVLTNMHLGTVTAGKHSSFFSPTSTESVGDPSVIRGAMNNPALVAHASLTLRDLGNMCHSGVVHINDDTAHGQAAFTTPITPGTHLVAALLKGSQGETYIEPLLPFEGNGRPDKLLGTIILSSVVDPVEDASDGAEKPRPHIEVVVAGALVHTGQPSDVPLLQGVEVLTMIPESHLHIEDGTVMGITLDQSIETRPERPDVTSMNAVRRYLGVQPVQTHLHSSADAASLPQFDVLDLRTANNLPPNPPHTLNGTEIREVGPGTTGEEESANPATNGEVPLVPAPPSRFSRIFPRSNGQP